VTDQGAARGAKCDVYVCLVCPVIDKLIDSISFCIMTAILEADPVTYSVIFTYAKIEYVKNLYIFQINKYV